MKTEIRLVIAKEMEQARAHFRAERYKPCFYHLECAHIIGQRYFVRHLMTHAWMLRVAIRRTDLRESIGQVMRLIAVVPGYLLGWVPKGNSGGANISAIKPMPAPDDLAPLIAGYNVWNDVAKRCLLWLLVLGALTAGMSFARNW